jgi:hypothetical protein
MKIEQIKTKIETGDYITLGKMLGCNADAARMRFRRNDDEAIDAMARIIEAREELINNYKNGEA